MVYHFLLSAGNMLTFMVGQKQAFEASLADVSQTQLQGKNDVILEFHVDDTTGANEVCFRGLTTILMLIVLKLPSMNKIQALLLYTNYSWKLFI